MAIASTTSAEDLVRTRGPSSSMNDNFRSLNSAVSWGAIAAGAAAAAALSLILMILGVGLGLSSVSPWAQGGVSATTLGVSTIIWLTVTQLLASAMGGYLAGRLRTKWTEVHRDEVYFRDTAHGFLAWAVASLATAALLTSVIGSILGSGAQAGTAMIGGVATSAVTAQTKDGGSMAYFVDLLFRADAAAAAPPASPDASQRATAEVSRIFMHVSATDPLPAEDVRYVGQLVAQRTGLPQPDAERRVADVYAKAQTKARDVELVARSAADKARKASAYSALWLFVSLLTGAFFASLAATYGGQRRDA